ncbi:hypothetical protein ACTFIW_011092 [Dictyostelium discoideum]
MAIILKNESLDSRTAANKVDNTSNTASPKLYSPTLQSSKSISPKPKFINNINNNNQQQQQHIVVVVIVQHHHHHHHHHHRLQESFQFNSNNSNHLQQLLGVGFYVVQLNQLNKQLVLYYVQFQAPLELIYLVVQTSSFGNIGTVFSSIQSAIPNTKFRFKRFNNNFTWLFHHHTPKNLYHHIISNNNNSN